MWRTHGDGIERLKNLPAAPPQAPPVGHDLQRMETDDYLENLRHYSWNAVDPELLDDRQDIWLLDRKPVPEYWYLRGETQEAHMFYHGWVKVIMEDLKCDPRACQAFVKLFKTMPPGAPHGFMEASRVLAHVLKDKMKPEESWKPGREDWSRFMQRACEEAIEALENHQHLRSLPLQSSGSASWGTQHVPAPGDPAGSDDGLKGKGKGKVFQKGKR